MKKLFTILTAVILTVLLCTACSGAKSVDLKALMDDINSTYGLSDLKQIEDADGLNRYYQIEADAVKQFAAELTTAASNYNEVILIEAADQNAAQTIKKQLEMRLRSQLSNAKSYDAEQVSMIEGCTVQENGNYLTLVVGDKHEEIEAKIAEALK